MESQGNLTVFKVICYCLRRVLIEHCLHDCLQNKTLYVYYDAVIYLDLGKIWKYILMIISKAHNDIISSLIILNAYICCKH